MGHRAGGVRRRHHPRLLRRHAARRRQTVLRLCQGRSDLQRRHRTFAQHAARRGPTGRWTRTTAAGWSSTSPGRSVRRWIRGPAPTTRSPPCTNSRFSSKTPRRSLSETSAWRATGGVRAASMFNLGRRYTIQGKFYFDPRANVVVALPRFHVAGRNLTLRLGGGVGWHTKFPTMDSLYPDTEYFDFTQLNYWPANPALRRINLRLYTLDPTNYDPACRTQFQMGGSPRRRLERQPAVGDLFPRRHDVGIPHDVGLSELHLPGLRRNGDRHGTVGRSPVARRHPLYGREAVGRVLPLDQRQPHGKVGHRIRLHLAAHPRDRYANYRHRRLFPDELLQHAPPSTCCRPPPPEDRAILTSGTTFRRTVTCAKCAIPIFCSTRRFPA